VCNKACNVLYGCGSDYERKDVPAVCCTAVAAILKGAVCGTQINSENAQTATPWLIEYIELWECATPALLSSRPSKVGTAASRPAATHQAEPHSCRWYNHRPRSQSWDCNRTTKNNTTSRAAFTPMIQSPIQSRSWDCNRTTKNNTVILSIRRLPIQNGILRVAQLIRLLHTRTVTDKFVTTVK
jgi:hypothetical protein